MSYSWTYKRTRTIINWS